MNRRRAASFAVAIAAVSMLSGCSVLLPTPIPDPVDLLCTWEQEEFGTTLTFRIDGDLEYSGLPVGFVDPTVQLRPDEAPGSMNGTGSWELGDGHYLRASDGRPVVGLNTDGQWWWLYVAGSGDDVRLYAHPDLDHSKHYDFEKHDCAERGR